MVVSKFRFVETTGAGGESNPCVGPIFDETIVAPLRVQVQGTNTIIHEDLHTAKVVERSATIGNLPPMTVYKTTEGLFDDPQQMQQQQQQNGQTVSTPPPALPTIATTTGTDYHLYQPMPGGDTRLPPSREALTRTNSENEIITPPPSPSGRKKISRSFSG